MSLALKENSTILIELQDKLDALWRNKNSLNDEIWHINDEKLYIGAACQMLAEKAPFFTKNGITPGITIKLLLLNLSNKASGLVTMKRFLNFMVLMFAYMQNKDIAIIDKDDVQEIFAYYLMHRLNIRGSNIYSQENKIIRRLTPRSGGSCTFLKDIIQQISHTLSLHGIEVAKPVVSDLSTNKATKIIKQTISQISLGDLTYQDWMAGESFNHLTLDHGRHYVEFMHSFYEDNYPIAQALNHVFSRYSEILSKVELSDHNNTRQIIKALLMGGEVEKVRLIRPFSKNKLDKLKDIIEKEYNDCIQPVLIKQYILQEHTLKRIAKMIGIVIDEDRFTHIVELERLRNLLFFILDDNEYPNLNNIIKNSNFDIDETKLKQIIATVSKEVPKPALPTAEYIEQYVGEYFGDGKERRRDLLTFIRKVKHAGICCVVAFTGWRRSEFGFPLSSISSVDNHDIIDQYALPYRHKVRWQVFKTHKGALIEREITQKTLEIILSLSQFHKPQEGEPAIYSETYSNFIRDISSKQVSGQKIVKAAADNWYNFYIHYKPFVALSEIVEFGLLSQKPNNLTNEQSSRLAELTEKKNTKEWQYAKGNLQLKETYEHVKKGMPAISYMQLEAALPIKRDALEHYHRHLLGENSEIHPHILSLFEERLPLEVKQRLARSESSHEVNALKSEVGAFLYSGLIYPTPHAFRHMWAEAVFRRFDGDAGWMIRSNFKHISESMWLAYIADKTTMGQTEQLRVNVSSTLMKNWLKNKGSKTSGKYHTFLKRLFKNTSLATYQEAESLIDKIANTDVISIKANPWGFCINRRSTSSLAKCAKNREAQPQNASPELCMGCINFMNCDANIDYIIEQSWQHIDLLNSDHLAKIPQALIGPSVSFVSNARKRISEIDPKHEILKQYDSALAKAA